MNEVKFDGLLTGYNITSGKPATKQSDVTISFTVSANDISELAGFLTDNMGILGIPNHIGVFTLRWETEE